MREPMIPSPINPTRFALSFMIPPLQSQRR
jgi:hypothetical protein